jgi:sialic acid synthase SpsE
VINQDPFEDLFVLEMTNNHQGRLDRALAIVRAHSRVVRFNGVRAAIKLQFRDTERFVHPAFRDRTDIRYIRRVMETRLSNDEYRTIVEHIRKNGCIPMATPFDERSVDLCEELELPIIKIASADSNDWMLVERIAKTRKPVIVSFGGTPLKDMDDLVTFFERRNIPLAINHCIAAYPYEDSEAQLHQIDFLRNRYQGHTIGYSSHEYHDWSTSIQIAYGKGARTFERHIDIADVQDPVAAYSSLPEQVDTWFKAFKKAREFCGNAQSNRLVPLDRERAYLDSYVRGAYAARDIGVGEMLQESDLYMAIPLQKGQLSTRELMLGTFGHRMLRECKRDEPLTLDHVDTPYGASPQMRQRILERGI